MKPQTAQRHPRKLSGILGLADSASNNEDKPLKHKRSNTIQKLTIDSDRFDQVKQHLQSINQGQKSARRVFRVRSETKIKDGTLRIKEQLGRISLLRNGYETTQEPLRIVFEVLDWLGKTENFYTEAFQYISQTLRRETVFDCDQFDPVILQKVVQKTNSSRLIKALSTKDQMMSYKEVCKVLSMQMQTSQQKMQEERQSYQQYIEELNRLIVEKRQTIGKMKDTVKYYSHHPSQDLYPYIQELEAKVRDQLKDIDDQQNVIRQTSSNVDVLISTNLLLSDKIDELNSKLYEIQIQKLSGTEKVQKNSELADFEKNVVSLKGMLDKSVVRMLGMKEEFQRLKNHNERLVSQRTQLVKRAAVGFSQLTPRPNIRKIFQQNEIDYERVFENNEQMRISTDTLVKTLIAKFKKMYVNSKESQTGKKIVLDPNGRPLNKFKNPTDQVMRELKKNKEMLRTTEQSAQMLKTKHARQLQQKRKLIEDNPKK